MANHPQPFFILAKPQGTGFSSSLFSLVVGGARARLRRCLEALSKGRESVIGVEGQVEVEAVAALEDAVMPRRRSTPTCVRTNAMNMLDSTHLAKLNTAKHSRKTKARFHQAKSNQLQEILETMNCAMALLLMGHKF